MREPDMKIEQRHWTPSTGWSAADAAADAVSPTLVFVFGATEALQRSDVMAQLRERYPRAPVFGCSTAGEIRGDEVLDDSLVATAVQLEHSRTFGAYCDLTEMSESYEVGRDLAARLQRMDG